jgi:integrase
MYIYIIHIISTMAKINFLYRGNKKDEGNLSIRLVHGKDIDYRIASPITSFKKYWFKRTTKNGKTVTKHIQLKDLITWDGNGVKHKTYLTKIATSLKTAFLQDYNNGVPITKEWLKSAISTTTTQILDTKEKIDIVSKQNQEKEDSEQKIKDGIIKANLLNTAIEKMFIKYQTNRNELKKYKVTYNMLDMYQQSKKQTFKIKDLNQDFADEFMNWSLNDMKYSKSYINAQLKRLRSSAVNTYENDEKDIIEVSKKLKTFKMFDKVYKDKIVITLDYDELDKIDNKVIEDPKLQDAKKAILIGCETGLRYSDLNKLVDSNIRNIDGVNYWKFRTDKTDAIVQITISERILYLIGKYGIPQTTYPGNGVKLNKDIKKVCANAEIDEMIKGSKATVMKINNKKVTRNFVDQHPKHKLITSRTFRRSFATNYYGKIDTSLITAVTGHSTEKQLRAYINVEDESNIQRTKNQIDKFHEERKKAKNDIKLTVIPKETGS